MCLTVVHGLSIETRSSDWTAFCNAYQTQLVWDSASLQTEPLVAQCITIDTDKTSVCSLASAVGLYYAIHCSWGTQDCLQCKMGSFWGLGAHGSLNGATPGHLTILTSVFDIWKTTVAPGRGRDWMEASLSSRLGQVIWPSQEDHEVLSVSKQGWKNSHRQNTSTSDGARELGIRC